MVRGDRERDRPNQRSLEKIEKAKRGSQKPRPCAHELAGRRKQTCRPTTVAGRAAKYRTRWVMGRGHFRRTPPSARFSAGRHWPVPPPESGGVPDDAHGVRRRPRIRRSGAGHGGARTPRPPSGISPENPRLETSPPNPSGDGPREKDRAGRGPRVRGQCRGPRSTSLVRRSGSDRRRELSGDPRPSAERATRLDGRRGPPA